MRTSRFNKPFCGLMIAVLFTAGCTPQLDSNVFHERMYSLGMTPFKNYWLDEFSILTGRSRAQAVNDWNTGASRTDVQAAKNGYWDLSTDFCSNSPDTGPHFDFKQPCARHDYGWRNLKKLQSRWGSGWNTRDRRLRANTQFRADMGQHCSGRALGVRQACESTAAVYYQVVQAAT